MTYSQHPTPVETEVATERDPRQFPVGLFSADFMGVGMFQWYTDGAEALQSYARYDIIENLAAGIEEVEEAVTAVLAGAEAAGKGLGDVVDELNEACDGESNLRWVGTFDELVAGDSEFARDMRRHWWEAERYEDELDEEGAEPSETELERHVPADKIEAFVEFLSQYGF